MRDTALAARTTAQTAFLTGDAEVLVNDIYPRIVNVPNLISAGVKSLDYALVTYDETVDRKTLAVTDIKYVKLYFIINNVCNDKGFDIIGVSDDDSNLDAWRKAVEKDGLPWHHVLRGVKLNKDTMEFDKTKDNTAGYNITGLPTKVLIDPSGRIIVRYSGGPSDETELDQQLAGIFPI